MTRTLYDASSPPPDPHLDVCAFYCGGDTPHVWTDQEIAGQSARWRLPIYVCDNPAQRNPTADAGSAVAWLRAHSVPAGSALALDFETAVDGTYVTAFDRAVTAAGWTVLLYGSLSTVTRNPRPSAGYWTASWTGSPHLDPGAAATQYISDTMLGKGYDLSVVADGLVLWDTHVEDDMTPDQANQLQQLTNAVFYGGGSMGATPPGAANNSLVSKVDYVIAAAEKSAAPTIAPADLAAAVKTALQDPEVVAPIASAVVAQLGADITKAA